MPLDFSEISDELHKQIRKNFTRRKVVSLHVNEIWGTDLIDFQEYEKENDGFKYLLSIIDVFSKYAWLVPLRDKKATTITKAFHKVIEDSGTQPKQIWSDKGGEYWNAEFGKFLKKNNIGHYSTYGDSKCVVAERFNRTIKTWIWKYFTAKHTRNWVNILDEINDYYNQQKHRSIGMKPIDAIKKENYQKVFDKLYGETLHEMINAPPEKPKFDVDDVVRVGRIKETFEKGFHDTFTRETFKVNEVLPTYPITYRLVDMKNKPIEGSFYTAELLKTKEPEFYEIDNIVKEKTVKGKKKYLVHWLGWPKAYDSWLDADELVDIH
jgi:hypothetical protein